MRIPKVTDPSGSGTLVCEIGLKILNSVNLIMPSFCTKGLLRIWVLLKRRHFRWTATLFIEGFSFTDSRLLVYNVTVLPKPD
jgi:hypothetical protein